ncbi:MAG: SDR family oxidoreductase [Ferruginibacter sp.]|nr:SDR family oxidoreductase [Cytophagales bacterium]
MEGKVVIITGASSGIGKACAAAFGKAGAKVVITGRREEALRQASGELAGLGIDHRVVVADVSVEGDNQETIRQTVAHYGRIDVLINNAGITMRAMFEETDVAVIKKVMDTNFYGTVYATKHALPYLRQTNGSIVGISSIAGYRGLPVRCGYSASKFAMQGFLEALRTELLHQGVHVLVACPGFTTSNIRNAALVKDGSVGGESPRDEEKMMSAEEVAQRILRATRRRQRDLILTTQGKLTIFLNKWFPAFMDQMVYNTLAKEKDSPLKRER